MAASSEFQDHLADLFAPLGGVSLRKMFGGLGVFRDGVMFAMVADDALYLKADGETEGDFNAEDCGPFIYTMRGKEQAMPYWRLPDRLYDDPDEFTQWAAKAFDVAKRTAKPKKAKKKKG